MTTTRDVTDRIGDLTDYLAANPVECRDADWRAWRQLLIYAFPALNAAPDSVRLELAAKLNPWRPIAEALQPFADLLDTSSNGYERSSDDEIVRSVGTLGRDYAVITVRDLRSAAKALAALRAAGITEEG